MKRRAEIPLTESEQRIKRGNEILREIKRLDTDEVVRNSTPIPPKCGIYFLLKAGRIIYIGKSTNVLSRLGQHANSVDFDTFTVAECDIEVLDFVENVMIAKFKPELNKKLKDNDTVLRFTL